MRKGFVVVVFTLTACSGGGEAATTTSAPPATFPPVPTTSTTLPIELASCETPQVTFSPLCETYELIEDWYVDRPIDAAVLADAARTGLANWSSDATADPPRTLICAIPDPAFSGLCGDLALRVQTEMIPIGDAVEAAVLAMTDLGLDPFSFYLPPEQVGAFRNDGLVGGIGVVLDATDAIGSKCVRISPVCQLQVVYVLEDNPGAEAGIENGDVILAIDGETVDGLGFVDSATRIAGDETGKVALEVNRNGTTIQIEVDRRELVLPTVEVEVPLPRVGYIRIPDFEDDIYGLLLDGLDSLLTDPVDTIVIDLRDNGGGYVDVALDVIDEFVDEGVLIKTKSPDQEFEYSGLAGGLATRQDLVILVNEGTASAAEMMAAALRDLRGAPLVGASTFGKDKVQIPFELNNGGEFHLVVERWFSPNDTSVFDVGLSPDYEVDLPADLSTEELLDLTFDTIK